MKRLKSRGHVKTLALTPGASSKLDLASEEVIVDKPEKVFRRFWSSKTTFVVIGALGAVIRIIAPLLTDKESDPAVVVLDAKAQNIVPILGGHKGGAEELSCQLAQDLGGKAVFTGFSRTEKVLAIDSFGYAWGWKRTGDNADWNDAMISLSNGSKITFEQTAGSNLWSLSEGAAKACQFLKNGKHFTQSPLINICSEELDKCCWHPATLWIGIGCERNTSQNLIERSIKESLNEAGLAKESIAGLATIDIKSDEASIRYFQKKESLPLRFFSAKELLLIDVPNPSEIVQAEIGTSSVAESASILAAGENGTLKYEKHIYRSEKGEKGAVTIAIAQSMKPFSPSRGELHLVGSGPGELSFLTHDSRFALSRCAIWIGYKRYLDLLESFRRCDQVRIDSDLTNERARCLEALELATQGIRVALVSSGDSGIYGMAGLALELWLEKPKSDRPEFKVHPGISSLQMAAARIGAPLMNDFCAISLSDCLTSWAKILTRIQSASISDFVIAFYNPRSKDRDWQLKKALDVILESRAPSTPVVFARQLGRSDEKIEVHTLGNFPVDRVDMLSLILVGNTTSFFQDEYVVTPRGY
nr:MULTISPECIES: precorrin-3B C(17)-methyltransferase [unclassified Prochlorococcus]